MLPRTFSRRPQPATPSAPPSFAVPVPSFAPQRVQPPPPSASAPRVDESGRVAFTFVPTFPKGATPPSHGNRFIQRLTAPRWGDGSEPDDATIHRAAEQGVATPSRDLPFADRIQAAFGGHDLSDVRAHTGSEATASAHAMGAAAFTSGNHVVFAGTPDLRTVAHETAHLVQQRAGVQLAEGIGRNGDAYECQADAVAARVAGGGGAEGLLRSAGGGGTGAVQRFTIAGKQPKSKEYDDKVKSKNSPGFERFWAWAKDGDKRDFKAPDSAMDYYNSVFLFFLDPSKIEAVDIDFEGNDYTAQGMVSDRILEGITLEEMLKVIDEYEVKFTEKTLYVLFNAFCDTWDEKEKVQNEEEEAKIDKNISSMNARGKLFDIQGANKRARAQTTLNAWRVTCLPGASTDLQDALNIATIGDNSKNLQFPRKLSEGEIIQLKDDWNNLPWWLGKRVAKSYPDNKPVSFKMKSGTLGDRNEINATLVCIVDKEEIIIHVEPDQDLFEKVDDILNRHLYVKEPPK